MSETNEKTKVRAILEDGVLTFPTTGNSISISKVFPTYKEMTAAQQYIVEYGFRQTLQDCIAADPKEGTRKSVQQVRIDLLLKGERPTKASTAKGPQVSLNALEKGVFELACKTGDVSMINLLATIPNGISKERAAELVAAVAAARDTADDDTEA